MLALRIEHDVPGGSDEELGALFSKIIAFWSAGLLPHFTAEGECLLARLVRHVPEDDARVRRTLLDHLRIEAFVASMRDATTNEDRRALLLEFGEALRIHVRWEEAELFPDTEATLTEEELTALGADLDVRLPETTRPWDAP